MPVTSLDFPILQRFFCAIESSTGMPPQPLDATPEQAAAAKARELGGQWNQKQHQMGDQTAPLPKGVVLGPDGKPCRTCTSVSSWMAMTKAHSTSATSASSSTPSSTPTSSTSATPSIPPDCPPDVEQLGRSSWTLLHSLTATYPERPTLTQQSETRQFLRLFGKMYPCWVCAEDFQNWMASEGNAPRVSDREEFGRWMCEAHNAVNVKLGKTVFDCGRWEERWRTGWKDGRCG